MRQDIVAKLAGHLSRPVDDECRVVYLLAELRKLLSQDDPNHQYGALWMYCHWALHVDLDKPNTTVEFLRRVDRWVTNTVAYLTPSGPWKFIEEYKLFEDFVFLATLREQLRTALAGYGLPTMLCDVDAEWYAFLEAYSGVIEDGSLSMKVDKANVLEAVERVTFTKGDTLTADHHVSFVIQWDIALKDGRTLKTSAETVPNGDGNMTAHRLQIVNGDSVAPYVTEYGR